MKIVDLKTFRALPEGTLFMKYEPVIFGCLQVKGETWEYDFLCNSISDTIGVEVSILDQLEGYSFDLDFNTYGRDGTFEESQLFAVYEKKDVEKLIKKLNECFATAYT